MSFLTRSIIRCSVNVAQRSYATITGYPIVKFVGRVGAKPISQEIKTAADKSYFRFPIAVTLYSKKDAEGKPLIDEKGYPVRETSWVTVFSFKEDQHAQLEALEKGTIVEIEADLIEREHKFSDGYVPTYPVRQNFYRQRELKVIDEAKR